MKGKLARICMEGPLDPEMAKQVLATRIPCDRLVAGLEYGTRISCLTFSGYLVRIGHGPWVPCTQAYDPSELPGDGTDQAILSAIKSELREKRKQHRETK